MEASPRARSISTSTAKEAALKELVESVFLARCHSFFAAPSEYPGLPEDPADLLDFTLERDVQLFEFLWPK